MVVAHNLGFPRMGSHRNLKWALEHYWQGKIDQSTFETQCKAVRSQNWEQQIKAQHWLSVGDFSWYDHVLDTSMLLGVIPERFSRNPSQQEIDTYFLMARGRARSGNDTRACEMTKWFDTNYHIILPEFTQDQTFNITSHKLFSETLEAKQLGSPVKPILLGPLTYLWLGKSQDRSLDKLSLLPQLRQTYLTILQKIQSLGIEWIQIDEPILVLDLPEVWRKAFHDTYQFLQVDSLKILLTTYFGDLGKNTTLAFTLPTAGLHVDIVRGKEQLNTIVENYPDNKILSVGIVDGRNVWRTDLKQAFSTLQRLHQSFGDRLWVASACSLMHSPVDLSLETNLHPELKNWLAFATQKLFEISILAKGLNQSESAITQELNDSEKAVHSRKNATRIHDTDISSRMKSISPQMVTRNKPFAKRKIAQQEQFKLPLFPTTTIGSFPQTDDIRVARQQFKSGKLDQDQYKEKICKQIALAIKEQEQLDIDVLVHGEAERNDMVEYFGELLQGFAFTEHGWVQSYGSRCVKPPIIFGDVKRAHPMTVDWSTYAQSLTHKPVKGMLTGPNTILCWSFVRDDQPRFETAKQIALALRDEVDDLVNAGIKIIQIDEPAIREGLPLKHCDWETYLSNAVYCFKLASSSVNEDIQIHTHMCYSEFNDIIESVAHLDADVITIETSRSHMELLRAFENFKYPNDIGPGVYDIHSPRIPTKEEIVELMEKAAQLIPFNQLWVNPDCGLKTRSWDETRRALGNMVNAAKKLRHQYSQSDGKKTKEETQLP